MYNVDNWLIDHTGIRVSDIHRSSAFYEAVLEPLGAGIVMRISTELDLIENEDTEVGGVAFGRDYPMFWIDVFESISFRQHTAFRATSREQVDAFYQAGLSAGGTDNGAPGLRDEYVPGYYAAFLLDPDGNNIEAVFREG